MATTPNSAFQIPGARWTLESAGDIPRYRFVSVNAAGKAILANATSPVVGSSQNQTKAGEKQEILGGIVIVEASAAIVAGTQVTSNATGQAVTGGSTGIAITNAAAAGDLVSVLL